MNSTEPPGDAEARIAAFYDTVLAPIAAAAREAGQDWFAAGPDAAVASYWTPRARSAMSSEDFRAPCCRDETELARCLQQHWQREGHDGLAALAPRFAELARAARSRDADLGDVPDYIYTMF